jgi:hypothetical protein
MSDIRFQGLFVVKTNESPVKQLLQPERKAALSQVDFRIFPSATQPNEWVMGDCHQAENRGSGVGSIPEKRF